MTTLNKLQVQLVRDLLSLYHASCECNTCARDCKCEKCLVMETAGEHKVETFKSLELLVDVEDTQLK